jgi:hypothetical protein
MVNVGIVMTIWYNFWSFGIIYGRLVLLVAIWHIFPILVCLDQEQSGNPGCTVCQKRMIVQLLQFMAIWYSLWSFDTFSRFGMLGP